jgi:anti-anti-sigma factor
MTELASVAFEERVGVSVARVKGEIDMTNAEDLTQRIGSSLSNAAPGIALDLSQVTYLDSSGIRVLFELATRLRHRGQRITLAVKDDAPLRRVLQLTDVSAMIPVYESVDEACSGVLEATP